MSSLSTSTVGKEQVETAYGRARSWEELPNRRACRVADYSEASSIMDEEGYEAFIDGLLDAGVRLRSALDSIPPPPAT